MARYLPVANPSALHRWFIVLFLITIFAAPLRAIDRREKQLIEAASKGDATTMFDLLRAGVSGSILGPDGDAALHAAVRAGSFDAARLLLVFGESPSLQNREGLTAFDVCQRLHGWEHLDLFILLRAFDYLETIRSRPMSEVVHRDRVLILENTVNYLHPRIARHYATNTAELQGKPGVDDDGNGYVDDTYGWDPETETPYVINPLQFEVYLKNRDIIGQLLQVEERVATGKISRFEGARILNGYSNPLAQIMGPTASLTDGAFVKMVKSAAHGSHVAGIIIDASDGYAEVTTVRIPSVLNSDIIFGDKTESIIVSHIRTSGDLDEYLQRCRQTYLEQRTAFGLRYAKYIRSTGAGVANLSFGTDLNYAQSMVKALVGYYLNATEMFLLDEDELNEIIDSYTLDFYLADAVPWATVFHLNPDVLFVCAAGNENEDNDTTYGSPGYLGRMMPNVITVAAVDRNHRITDFSDYGRHTVQISALGAAVRSTVIPESDVYMDGTSMAAPAVAGIAARLRWLDPTKSAAEVRSLLLYSSQAQSGLDRYTVSGGIADASTALESVQGDDATRVAALLKLARRALSLPSSDVPEGRYDATNLVRLALKIDARNAEAKSLLKQLTRY